MDLRKRAGDVQSDRFPGILIGRALGGSLHADRKVADTIARRLTTYYGGCPMKIPIDGCFTAPGARKLSDARENYPRPNPDKIPGALATTRIPVRTYESALYYAIKLLRHF